MKGYNGNFNTGQDDEQQPTTSDFIKAARDSGSVPKLVPQCRAKFELANGEFVSRCHLDLGHKEAHEGWCLGSKCHWPQGFTSEEEVNRVLDAEIVRQRIEIIELEKDIKP